MHMRVASMTAGLAGGVTLAVVTACAAGAYLYSSHHYETLLNMARADALAEGELIREALEHQMMENDRSLLGRMIESFGRQSHVERVALLDRTGTLRFSSRPQQDNVDLRPDSPTCRSCHQYPPEQRGSSRIVEARGGATLRTVIPIRNREACHKCHDAGHKINGILILDYDTGEIRAAMSRDMRWMLAGTGAVTLLLVGAIALVIHFVLLRRLRKFETAARLIAAGDLNRRVPAEGGDTISWLAREFNSMADSMTGLLTEVRSQRERLETVINSIDDGIVVLDPGRQVLAANDAFLQRAGETREHAVGSCCQGMVPGACIVSDCPSLACLRAGSRQVRICERRAPDGQVTWEEVHASPILDADGQPKQVVEVWRDISDRRAAEANLAESHRLASIGYLASGFSHELNTPMATVLMCVEGILREQPGDEAWPRIMENAGIAREQLLRCRLVTQHFLRMSRGQPSSADIVDLALSVAAVVRLIEPTAREHAVRIEVDPIPSRLHLRVDEAGLQDVLINLLLNAVQASQPGGQVRVRVAAGAAVHIRVSDGGCGIAPENLKRIFEPFFGLRKGGTGLGLFLSLNFVRRWGGDLTVESVPGQGSSFELALPALMEEHEQEVVE